MSNQRPFEVGDMLILGCNGVIKTIEDIRGSCLYLSDGWSRADDSMDIVTIRKPRKGNAESRAIVAMLLIRYRSFRKYQYHPMASDSCYCCYEIAKSMLK